MSIGQTVFVAAMGMLMGCATGLALMLAGERHRYRRLALVRCPECGEWIFPHEFTVHVPHHPALRARQEAT